MREARDRLRAILSAPTFDADAYRAAVASLDQTREARVQRFSTAIESLASHWPVEDRRALAELLNRPTPPQPKE